MKDFIRNSGKTIKEFSEYYGIPYNTVRQWANGERRAPEWVKNLINKCANGIQLELAQEKYKVIKKTYTSGLIVHDIYSKEEEYSYKADIRFLQIQDKKDYKYNPKWETFEVYKKFS